MRSCAIVAISRTWEFSFPCPETAQAAPNAIDELTTKAFGTCGKSVRTRPNAPGPHAIRTGGCFLTARGGPLLCGLGGVGGHPRTLTTPSYRTRSGWSSSCRIERYKSGGLAHSADLLFPKLEPRARPGRGSLSPPALCETQPSPPRVLAHSRASACGPRDNRKAASTANYRRGCGVHDVADHHAVASTNVNGALADGRALKNQTGQRHEGQCFRAAPRTATALSAKKTKPKTPRPSAQAKYAQTSDRIRAKEGRAFWRPFL